MHEAIGGRFHAVLVGKDPKDSIKLLRICRSIMVYYDKMRPRLCTKL